MMMLNWWGKLLGGTFGFLVAGPAGALLGTVVGHNLDKSLGRVWGFFGTAPPDEQEPTQNAFLSTTFLVMGHMAKVDGRVSEHEIAVAQAVMTQLHLNAAQKETAVRLFREGKQADFPLDSVLDAFHRQCRYRFNLIYQFIEIQLNTAYADGVPAVSKRAILLHICDRLGFPRWQFEAMDAAIRNRYRYHSGGRKGHQESAGRRGITKKPMSLEEAYMTLGLKRGASDGEIKMSYRRLLNRYHPDKLAAQGLPKETMEQANEKTRQIKTAYDRIRQARGMVK